MEEIIALIMNEFDRYAPEIIARIDCGESVDSAIQTVIENHLKEGEKGNG